MVSATDRPLRKQLVAMNRQIRAGRAPIPENETVVLRRFPSRGGVPRRTGEMFQFWFRTRGCTFDRAGQCSMCNYGVGPEIDPDRIAKLVSWRLSKVPAGAFLYLSPSGSLLDEREVTPDLRGTLLAAAARREPAVFVFETRPELCTPEVFEEVRAAFPDSTKVVCHLGVESWDPWTRMMCQLKPTTQDTYRQAVRLAKDHDFGLIANIVLGGLGLTPAEAYADTRASVRGTRAAGFDTQMVFPLSAKSGTLLGWAHSQGLWEPPTLWTLVKLLAECTAEAEDAGREADLDISWFDPGLEGVIQARPDGCEVCRPTVVEALNRYRLRPSSDVLAPLLAGVGCDCLDRTEASLAAGDGREPRERLVEMADRWEPDAGIVAHSIPVGAP